MDIVKFREEVSTLKRFFEVYCKDNHLDALKTTKTLTYKKNEVIVELNLCHECLTKIEYSFDRLLKCPHKIKPRCRSCPSPCYEKKQWKETAKIMKYSGVKLGILSLNKKIKSIFKKN